MGALKPGGEQLGMTWAMIPLLALGLLLYSIYMSVDRVQAASVLDGYGPAGKGKTGHKALVAMAIADTQQLGPYDTGTIASPFSIDTLRLATDQGYTRERLLQMGLSVCNHSDRGKWGNDLPARVLIQSLEAAQRDHSGNQLPYHIKQVGRALVQAWRGMGVSDDPGFQTRLSLVNQSISRINPDLAMESQQEEIREFFRQCGFIYTARRTTGR